MREADGFILASPTYYAGIAGTMKAFLYRVFSKVYPHGINRYSYTFSSKCSL